MTEREKKIRGMIYDPSDTELLNKRNACHALCDKYNLASIEERNELVKKIFPNSGKNLYIEAPVHCDYGEDIIFGDNCYANFNLTVLDIATITIGDNVFMGPNVSLMTALHPLRFQERNPYLKESGVMTDKEYGASINIGSNCWICANVTIIAGVSIGEGCVIGAGSVVTKDIPSNSLAVGNPCKVIRKITEEDSIYKS